MDINNRNEQEAQVENNTQQHPDFNLPPQNTVGPVIGIIIIVALLALGGVYFWHDEQVTLKNETLAAASTTPAQTDSQSPKSVDAVIDSLKRTSSKDTAAAMERDLQSTNTGNSSQDLQVQ